MRREVTGGQIYKSVEKLTSLLPVCEMDGTVLTCKLTNMKHAVPVVQCNTLKSMNHKAQLHNIHKDEDEASQWRIIY